MRAAVYHGAGDVRLADVPAPRAPGPDEVVIDVVRVGLCGTDAAEYGYGPIVIPLTRTHPASHHAGPVVIGHEFMGRVRQIGSDVTGFIVGQRVACGAGVYCGRCAWCRDGRPNLCADYYTLGLQADGGLTEQVRVPAKICVPVPDGCSDDVAVLAQPLAIALHALDRAAVQPHQSVLISGIGGIGAFLVAAAIARGCTDIIALDISDDQLSTASRLGAAHVVNPTKDDLRSIVSAATGGEGAAVSMEASGAPGALATAIGLTRRGGRVALVGIPKSAPTIDTADITFREIELIGTVAHVCDRNLPEALEILRIRPDLATVIDRVIDFDDTVTLGLEPLSRREVSGKVVVKTDR